MNRDVMVRCVASVFFLLNAQLKSIDELHIFTFAFVHWSFWNCVRSVTFWCKMLDTHNSVRTKRISFDCVHHSSDSKPLFSGKGTHSKWQHIYTTDKKTQRFLVTLQEAEIASRRDGDGNKCDLFIFPPQLFYYIAMDLYWSIPRADMWVTKVSFTFKFATQYVHASSQFFRLFMHIIWYKFQIAIGECHSNMLWFHRRSDCWWLHAIWVCLFVCSHFFYFSTVSIFVLPHQRICFVSIELLGRLAFCRTKSFAASFIIISVAWNRLVQGKNCAQHKHSILCIATMKDGITQKWTNSHKWNPIIRWSVGFRRIS